MTIADDDVDEREPMTSPSAAATAVESCATRLNTTFHHSIHQFDAKLSEQSDHIPRHYRSFLFKDDDDSRLRPDAHGSGWSSTTGNRRWRWKRQRLHDERQNRMQRRMTRIVDESGVCGRATMSAPGFVYRSSGWDCPGDLVLDKPMWQCITFGVCSSIHGLR